ncbi:ERVV2 protein, partial [Pterocles burchelli]|nr:ERVV2 protein [Pterocles burchelli]
TGFHPFAIQFIPWLEVSELEKAIINISATLEIIKNKTMGAIHTLQEVSETEIMALQNRMALDMLLASKGGVCTVINTSCCVCVDQGGRISTDLE